MTLSKISILLSTLYNSYLPYALYGPPLMPVIIMTITSSVLWYANFIEDQWAIKVIEFTSIVAGYTMIIGQCVIAHFANDLKYRLTKSKPLLPVTRANDNHHYDNISDEHLHGN